MSLYQEIRPTKLEDVIGNSATIGALRSMLRKSATSQPHAILLKGPTGCGKTTIARILAKEFGSNDISTFKIHANNTSGIDTIRNISKSAALKGLGGHTKTYVIDESHELSNRAQEGLLDILEDNPSHCYFVLCTTVPQNIIPAVRNRCAEYEVRSLSKEDIIKVLERACKVQSLKVSPNVLEAISMECDRSPRAALVSLEQICEIKDEDEAFEVLVGSIKKNTIFLDLVKLLVMAPQQREKNWKRILETFAALDEGHEILRKGILTFLFNKLRKQENIDDAKDITHLLRIFSVSTYYGGKSQLGSMIARACFETWKDN